MINPIQNVLVFGVASTISKDVTKDRDLRDIETDDGDVEENHHVEKSGNGRQPRTVRPQGRRRGGRPRVGHTPVEGVYAGATEEQQEQRVKRLRQEMEPANEERTEPPLHEIAADAQFRGQLAKNDDPLRGMQGPAPRPSPDARDHMTNNQRRKALARATHFLMSAMANNQMPDEDVDVEA
ncbi:hypothetical protein [Magnetofaba australis]|uniref:Uncharacterized protein n=1 Tax=Magnetofaba australis IT-1 TaxID=1434232 RepID=A0A1Y2K4E2_9PROT|nr:hypothetical protein [Magnetofaba australis]OSM04247.1 hypothetical protein MAIT1_04114 [Magnetofaba australis IT-1]